MENLMLLWWLWPISGWLCAYHSTPKWMLEKDVFGWVLLIVCGAIVGPVGIFWFFTNDSKWNNGDTK